MRSGIVSPFAGGRRWVVAAVGGITATLAAGLWLSLGRPSTPPMATAPVSKPTQDVREAVRDLTSPEDTAPDSPAAGTALPGLAADAARELGLDPSVWESDPDPLLGLETDWQVELPPELAQDSALDQPEPAAGPGPLSDEALAGTTGPMGDRPVAGGEQVALAELPVQAKPSREGRIAALLEEAQRALARLRLTLPKGESAYDYYQQVLDLEPGNARAEAGIDALVGRYVALARRAAERGELDRARRYLDRADGIRSGSDAVLSAREALAAREEVAQEAAERERLAALAREEEARRRRPQPVVPLRDRLPDGSPGPEMVIIPPGEYTLGPAEGGEGADTDEVPRREVVFATPFALGRYEVSVAEYLRFVKATQGHPPAWLRKGSPKSYQELGQALTDRHHPIVGISWEDAVAYTRWLSEQTGEPYRLPTEAEWEYAASATLGSRYWWGDSPSRRYANYGKEACCAGLAEGGDAWVYTAPVDAFPPNPFGLYNMAGNVWEWTCSRYDYRYHGQESQCADAAGGDGLRALRGGSWYSDPRLLRSANRYGASSHYRNFTVGFRLARDVKPSDSATVSR
jgi:formylglycine-generating enzyme required for sulfatase activity